MAILGELADQLKMKSDKHIQLLHSKSVGQVYTVYSVALHSGQYLK